MKEFCDYECAENGNNKKCLKRHETLLFFLKRSGEKLKCFLCFCRPLPPAVVHISTRYPQTSPRFARGCRPPSGALRAPEKSKDFFSLFSEKKCRFDFSIFAGLLPDLFFSTALKRKNEPRIFKKNAEIKPYSMPVSLNATTRTKRALATYFLQITYPHPYNKNALTK
jgi:hypothetical protein